MGAPPNRDLALAERDDGFPRPVSPQNGNAGPADSMYGWIGRHPMELAPFAQRPTSAKRCARQIQRKAAVLRT